MTDAQIDAQKLVERLIQKNGELVFDNTVKDLLIEQLQESNRVLTEALSRISKNQGQGEASEEDNAGPDSDAPVSRPSHRRQPVGDGEFDPHRGGDSPAGTDSES